MATPKLPDPNFHRTVVLLIQHDEDGTVGLVLNRVSMEPAVDHIPEWEGHLAPPGLVHHGGPVEPEIAIGLGLTLSGMSTGVPGLGLIDLSHGPSEDSPHIRVYSGYSGWGAGQLEEELDTGSWFLVPAAPDDPFADPGSQWRKVLRRQSGLLAVVSTFPEDPSLN